MTEAVASLILIIAIVLGIVWLERAGDPPVVLVDAAAESAPPPDGPAVQCLPPMLDYSRPPLRLDSKGIA